MVRFFDPRKDRFAGGKKRGDQTKMQNDVQPRTDLYIVVVPSPSRKKRQPWEKDAQ